ncbi:MAG TPA: TRAP transporter small permease subunit [Burkholderiaceae bacterium]|nr:TRAP transporter small permease subunit [Burkholderiaceae bacterium]
MARLAEARALYQRLLEIICFVLMAALALIVVLGVVYRTLGAALVWYDEIAAVLLAWITYYGAALAAYRGAHIGVDSLVRMMPNYWRLVATLFAEVCVIGFFLLLGWVGWFILDVLATDTLVSLPEVSVAYTQSVIPIGAALFVVAELLRLPEVLAAAAGASPADRR